MTETKKLPSEVIKLINSHAMALSYDKIDDQKHHLEALKSLVEAGLIIIR